MTISIEALYRDSIQHHFKKAQKYYFAQPTCYYNLSPERKNTEYDFQTNGQVTKLLTEKKVILKPPFDNSNPYDVRQIDVYGKEIAEQSKKMLDAELAIELGNVKNEVTAHRSTNNVLAAIEKEAKAFFKEKDIPEEYQSIIIGSHIINKIALEDYFVRHVNFASTRDLCWFLNDSVGFDGNKVVAYAFNKLAVGLAHTELGYPFYIYQPEIGASKEDNHYRVQSYFYSAAAILDESEVLRIKA